MGNDGGDIPGHKELVKQKQKVEVPDPQSVAVGRSRYCNLTKQRLSLPMAICRLGFIFNYEALLQILVEKRLHEKYSYIRKITDVRQVSDVIMQIHPQLVDSKQSQNVIMCPVSRLQYNGFNKFVALWSCGHVFSLKAFKEIKTKMRCLTCDRTYTEEDVVDLNMTPEEQEVLKKKLLERVKKPKKKEEEPEKEKIQKKIKVQVPLNKLEQLDGDISGIIRGRDNFKTLFHKEHKVEENLFVRNTKLGIR